MSGEAINSSPSSLSSLQSSVDTEGLSVLQTALAQASQDSINVSPSLSSNMSTSETITLSDGRVLPVNTTTKVIDDVAEFVRMKSSDRMALPQKDQDEMRYTITRKQHPVFKKMDVGSPDLDELVGFQSCLDTTERHFRAYDLHDIFLIVFPEKDSSGNVLPTMVPGKSVQNLFKTYGVLSLEDVQASNEWYRRYPTDSWYGDNMGLTYEYLKTHMASDLWTKVNEEYSRLPAATRGGPLLLYLMIKHLVAANDAVAVGLVKILDTVKISTYKGEDVCTVVSHLRALLARLKSLRRRDAAGHEIDLVPLDITRKLYKIFQSSSCDTFNRYFSDQERSEYGASLVKGPSAWSSTDYVLSLAENLYRDLCADHEWHGKNANKATFPAIKDAAKATAFLSQLKCHNCGGPHVLNDCTKPLDEARIKANRTRVKAIRQVAKQGSSSNSNSSHGTSTKKKWPPPPKKGEKNRTIIDGKDHFYHFKSKKWLPVDPARQGEANSAQPQPPSVNLGQKPPSSDSSAGDASSRAHARLVLANLQSQMSDALSAFNALTHE
jgi:hypothetical protein